jgi:predicted MFS family arabinose efflux permease
LIIPMGRAGSGQAPGVARRRGPVPGGEAVSAAEGAGPRLSRRLVLLLATTCGAAVANNYYAQPLLHTIANTFGVPDVTAGLLVTAGQAGYAIGLALLVPLGDLLERRRLICRLLVATAAAEALAAVAPGIAVLATALAVAGVTSVVAQIVVPMAASLAGEAQRGQVVGTVMSGLIIGILLARTVSGLIASAGSWRPVFVMAAAVMLLLAAVLRRALPESMPSGAVSSGAMSYRALLRSVLALVREEPVLRQRMGLGAAALGCFSILWTPVAFLLAGPPYRYGTAVIGLFGIAGLAGAGIAPVAGRLADRGRGNYATLGAIVALLGSWGLLAFGAHSLAALIAGIVVLDLGSQALHISNQSAIYALRPGARSRLNTAYMVSYFLGGAVMSAAASVLYSTAGWGGVCTLGAAVAAAALCLWLANNGRRGRQRMNGGSARGS